MRSITGLSAPLASPLVTYSTAAFRRASSPVTSRMLYPLTVAILRIISRCGDLGVILAQRAVDIDDALIGQRGNQLGKVRAANGIEGNACAMAVGDAHHLGDHVLLLGCNDMGCASPCSRFFLSEVRVSAIGVAPTWLAT